MSSSSNSSDSNKYSDDDRDLALAWNYSKENKWLYNVNEKGEIYFKKDGRINYPWMMAQEELIRHARKYNSNDEDYMAEYKKLNDIVFNRSNRSVSSAQNA